MKAKRGDVLQSLLDAQQKDDGINVGNKPKSPGKNFEDVKENKGKTEEKGVWIVEKIIKVFDDKNGSWNANIKWKGWQEPNDEPFTNLLGETCE